MIYCDVRPSAYLPTLELRVADTCPRLEDIVLLAGLFRAIAGGEIDAMAEGRSAPQVRTEVIRAETWRAARCGLEGELVDSVDGTWVPAWQLLLGLPLERYREPLEAAGDWDLVPELTQGGTGAR
ncbi:hypothetical protein [Actinomadura sp. NPDC048394]|uniref:carboxylate-amine ligase n=1 Tax=Actinomadura sp. NPDC048394 TaxID=3158223 RepID=UPI0033C747FD